MSPSVNATLPKVVNPGQSRHGQTSETNIYSHIIARPINSAYIK